jgi:hypothetical protein
MSLSCRLSHLPDRPARHLLFISLCGCVVHRLDCTPRQLALASAAGPAQGSARHFCCVLGSRRYFGSRGRCCRWVLRRRFGRRFLYFCLTYWSAALCYVITFSAMDGNSPTLSLTRHLHAKSSDEISHVEIERFFRQRPFVGSWCQSTCHRQYLNPGVGRLPASFWEIAFFRPILGYRRVDFGAVRAGG